MNYLSHFVLDWAWQTNHEVAGSALVDICRLRGRGFRLKVPNHVAVPEGLALCAAGIQRHYQLDAWWHNCLLFKKLTKSFEEVVKAHAIPFSRSYFLAHIGSEMLLDRFILSRRPDSGIMYYEKLAATPPTTIEAILYSTENGAWAKPVLEEWARFLNRKFLLKYTDDGYFLATLAGIYAAVTGQIVTIQQQNLLKKVLPAWDTIVQEFGQELFSLSEVDPIWQKTAWSTLPSLQSSKS